MCYLEWNANPRSGSKVRGESKNVLSRAECRSSVGRKMYKNAFQLLRTFVKAVAFSFGSRPAKLVSMSAVSFGVRQAKLVRLSAFWSLGALLN